MAKRCIYVALFIVMPVFSTTMTQTTSRLNLRVEPKGSVQAMIPKGAVVSVLRLDKSWAEVVYVPETDITQVKQGWVCGAFLKAFQLNSGAQVLGAPEIAARDCLSY